MDEFRAKRETAQAEMASKVTEPTAQEKAASRARMRERIGKLPKERREEMESRLAMSEEMEKFRAEEKSLSKEERRERMQQLMERRRAAMQSQISKLKEYDSKEAESRPKTPTQLAMEAEKQQLDAALESKNPEQRRAAMEKFRAAMNEVRETRLREMQERRDGKAPSLSPKDPSATPEKTGNP